METAEREPQPQEKPRSGRRRLLRWICLYAILPYASVVVIFAVFQRQLMYRPTVAESLSIVDLKLNEQFGHDVQLKTDDGELLRGWLINASSRLSQDGDGAPLVVYFPGNSLNRHERMTDLREFAARGFDVLIFDYRGFGDSTGSPSEASLSADALLIWNYARSQCNEARIVIFGESLGGGVALSLWDKDSVEPPQPAAVFLNSTFSSMQQTVAWHYPLFPFQFLLLDRWPSIHRIAQVDAPVTVYHGSDDQMVPVEHGRALAQTAKQATFIEIDGGTHNEIPMMRLRAELDDLVRKLSQKVNSAHQQ